MKKLLVCLVLFLSFGVFAQEDKNLLPKEPWEDIVEMNYNELSKISKWNKNIYIKLIGNYTKQNSLEVERIIRKYDSITESVSIKFATNNNANFKIKFLNKPTFFIQLFKFHSKFSAN